MGESEVAATDRRSPNPAASCESFYYLHSLLLRSLLPWLEQQKWLPIGRQIASYLADGSVI